MDPQGRASSRIVEPVRVEGGYLTGYDATRAAVQRFALHRITGVSEIDS
ncbi:WYL domain-containing protein [Actinomadura keratinilytica]